MRRVFISLFRKGESNGVKILCLGVGLAIGLTLLAEVIFQTSYDKFIPWLEDTYRLEERFCYQSDAGDWMSYPQVSGATAPGIKSYCPEVETATRFTGVVEKEIFMSEDGKEVACSIYMCDSSFFDMFPVPILMGESPHTGLEKEGCGYISRTLFEMLGQDIVGRTLTSKDYSDFHFTVIGVFDDFPDNTHLPRFNVALALPTIKWFTYDGSNNWLGNDRYKGYVRLRHGTDPEQLRPNIERMMDDHISEALNRSGGQLEYVFKPVGDIFFSSDYNRVMCIVFLSFAVIMLLTSFLNYVLLSLSSMVSRAKYMATYRCYGASSWDICRMVLAESFFHVGILSLALAVLIIFGLQDFLQMQLGHGLRALFSPSAVIACVLVTIVVVVACGLVPGYFYARIPVTYACRRYSESKRRWKLGLLFVQFMLTAFFVSLLVVVGLQYNMLTNYNTGFDYKHVLTVDLSGMDETESNRCVQQLKLLPDVVSVTWGFQSLAERCNGNNVYNPETGQEYMNVADMYDVGDDYLETFQIPLVCGDTFTPHLQDTVTRQVMVSRSFVERMRELVGWTDSPVGRSFFLTGHSVGEFTICGVYEDIYIGSQISEDRDSRPTVMLYNDTPSYNLYVRVREMSPETIMKVQQVVNETLARDDKIVTSLDIQMRDMYDSLLHVRNSVLFAGLCVLIIALVGLIAYIRAELSRRRSEIAIRVIHGASVADVEFLFLIDLLKIALPAILLGVLCAWMAGQSVLTLFAVKIGLTWRIFIPCIIAVLLLVMLLSAWLVWRASRTNPIENLRTE